MREGMENIDVTKQELAALRALPDFDLTMVLSEIHEHGWPHGRRLIEAATEAVAVNGGKATSPQK